MKPWQLKALNWSKQHYTPSLAYIPFVSTQKKRFALISPDPYYRPAFTFTIKFVLKKRGKGVRAGLRWVNPGIPSDINIWGWEDDFLVWNGGGRGKTRRGIRLVWACLEWKSHSVYIAYRVRAWHLSSKCSLVSSTWFTSSDLHWPAPFLFYQ